MLAGHKLLLADDSFTIQKVVDLTFADEGVQVIAVSNGAEAIEKLEEYLPDVVLADVFMPGMSGYQVCEYIKQNERLKHIPVMLLVGSFEPFDEAEARRVGADDILTKPFQSIRNLVDKVGGLLRGETVANRFEKVSLNPREANTAREEFSITEQEEIKTAELPKPEVVEPEPVTMDTAELELTTADTQQLPPDMLSDTRRVEAFEERGSDTNPDNEKMEMEAETQPVAEATREAPLDYGDALLDLGDVEPVPLLWADDDILDLGSPASEILPAVKVQATAAAEFQVEPLPAAVGEGAWASQAQDTVEWEVVSATSAVKFVEPAAAEETASPSEMVAAETGPAADEFEQPEGTIQQFSPQIEIEAEPALAATPATLAGQITLDQLSPEVIDAVARRAVEQLSEKAVQEIAWEVVPQLAELLIKRKLEEKESQAN